MPLPTVMIRCPSTGKPTPTGLAMDRLTFETNVFTVAEARCESCGGIHRWSKPDAWVEDQRPWRDERSPPPTK
jgi:hypothetical protein